MLDKLFNIIADYPLRSLGFVLAGSFAWVRFFEWVLA